VRPPNKVISIPLVSGTIGILFSKKYITNNEIKVAITNGGIAALRLLSPLKYIVKKISKGPKSAINLIIGLFIKKC
tara:strand:+ start:244 stop:471 length:228 start_codon:yes stop_codon:yes gene_type:complete